MTFPTMLQASNVYKGCKWKLSAAYGNYSGSARLGSGRLTCDYNAISVQLQLQLPAGTELGNRFGLFGLVSLVWYGRFGLVGFVQ